MKCKLAIFDLDGTILNTIDDLADSANYICRQHNFPEHTVDEIKFMVGNGIPKLVERFCPSQTSQEELKLILNEFIDYYKNHDAEKTRPYDGIIELMKNLKAKGIKLSVNTNKMEAAAIPLCNHYYPGIFDFISGGKDGVPPKPAPNGIYEILEKAGITKEEASAGAAVYIGDSDVDIQCGLNTNIKEIGVDWGFRGKKFLEEHGAKHIAMNPQELFMLLTE